MSFQENLQQWAAKEPERLLIELRDLRMAKQTAETKLQKIEKRMARVKKRLAEIRSTSCSVPGG